MPQRRSEVPGSIFCHEHLLTSMAVRYKSGVLMSSVDHKVAGIRYGFVTSTRTLLFVSLSYQFWGVPSTSKVTGTSEIGSPARLWAFCILVWFFLTSEA